MDSTPALTRLLPRWAAYAGLWLLVSSVFASQLYLSGYVSPWPRAFAAEAVYWLSWWLMLPALFWWCRRLRAVSMPARVVGLLLGAAAAMFVQPLIGQGIAHLLVGFRLCVGDCVIPAPLLSPAWFLQTVRNAGVNLPVYAGFVLAWYAVTFYRESRDRQMKAVELESLLRQAQLEALRSQLNPHFILNTFHALVGLVRREPAVAESALERLGDLLRYSLRIHRDGIDEVPLREECAFVDSYLALERLRLADRLQVEVDTPEATLDYLVPTFAVQILVENAIRHAIAPRAAGGRLLIRAQQDDGRLHVAVTDEGATEIAGAPNGGSGMGLRLLQERLAALYGGRATLTLRPVDGGTCAELELPARRVAEEVDA